jgi:hypothetical protein
MQLGSKQIYEWRCFRLLLQNTATWLIKINYVFVCCTNVNNMWYFISSFIHTYDSPYLRFFKTQNKFLSF